MHMNRTTTPEPRALPPIDAAVPAAAATASFALG